MNTISGIGTLDRQRLTAVLRGTKQTISVIEATQILGLPKTHAAKLLARWAAKGWLSRVKQGIYIPVPLESATANLPLEDPWIIAERLYHPCYIGAWSAAEYWGLTEQIFRTIVLLTTKKIKNRHPNIKGTKFLLRTTSPKAMFGLQPIWRDQIKIFISDPTRTVLDLLTDPQLGGGIRPTVDVLNCYLKSKNKDLALLVDYAKQLNNGAVFKRLGFLLELYAPGESEFITICKNHLTKGNTKLDTQLSADKLVTRWRLWVSREWIK